MNMQRIGLLPLLLLGFGSPPMAAADPAQYILNGVALGDRISASSSNYRAFKCRPSTDFLDYTWCKQSQRKRARDGSRYNIYSTIVHTQQGTAHYLMTQLNQIRQNQNGVKGVIERVSRSFNQQPLMLKWSANKNSVIAVWGKARIEEISGDARELISEGKSPRQGIMIDTLGNLGESVNTFLPIYRITGGEGYIFAASFNRGPNGHQRHVAIDAQKLLISKYKLELSGILQQDASLPKGDYGLWPKVAGLTRTLSLDTTPAIANQALDGVFTGFPSRKLWSHLWSILPGSTTKWLALNIYSMQASIFGPDTTQPAIRQEILDFIANNPSDSFIEFAYFAVGQFEKALEAKPNSVIRDVLHYASGFNFLGPLVLDAHKAVIKHKVPHYYVPDRIVEAIGVLNLEPEFFSTPPLSSRVAGSADRITAARHHFEMVLQNRSARHADDAAYMLGWLSDFQGRHAEARDYYSKAMNWGNGDYKKPAAMKQVVRSLQRLPPDKQGIVVNNSDTFKQYPALWYTATRSSYRNHDYANTIKLAEQALTSLDIPVWRIPETTDPEKIIQTLERVNKKLRESLNLPEIVYVLNASKEILGYTSFLKSLATQPADSVNRRVRQTIIKYSMLHDKSESNVNPGALHKDLRQAAYLADISLQYIPKTAGYALLREWLYYRKIRILVDFSAAEVGATIAAMEQEYPNSNLLDDALTERLYVEGLVQKNPEAMKKTFALLNNKFPNGNAIDNAHTWMAIALSCMKRSKEAKAMNRTIVQRFPLTRHAAYAMKRMVTPPYCYRWNFPFP